MVKSKIESGLNKASKKALKGAVRVSRKAVKKSIKNTKKAVKKVVKAVKKKSTRKSVSGRKYRGLTEANKRRIEERIKARKLNAKDKLVKRKTDLSLPSDFDNDYDYKKAKRLERINNQLKNLSIEQTIKRANDRLRRLEYMNPETHTNLAEDSNEYRLALKYATEQPNAKGKIYNQEKLFNENRLRFLSYDEYKKLSKEDKTYFRNVLKNFLRASTSTEAGINSKYEKALETFTATYGDIFKDVDEYKKFFRTFRDYVTADKNNHFDYNNFSQALEFLDIESILSSEDYAKTLQYAFSGDFENVDRKYRNKNYW